MSELEEKILKTIGNTFPLMTEEDKRHLLYFGEGMAFNKKQEKEQEERELLAAAADGGKEV